MNEPKKTQDMRFADLPTFPERGDGRPLAAHEERRQLGPDVALTSGKIFRFGFKRYSSPQDGKASDAFIVRAIAPDGRVSDETLSVPAAAALQVALREFFEVRRLEALTRPAMAEIRARDSLARPATVAPPSGPQPSRLTQRKREAEVRRAGVPRGTTAPR